jgi:hypothetical protein
LKGDAEMKWFTEVFLPSMIEKEKKQPEKYRGQVILSDKQVDICRRYMNEKQCHGDYGYFTVFEFEAGSHRFQLCEAGKYTFLHIRLLDPKDGLD